jgi:ABC-type glycerol-3-phosphate transport system substrate-binding protein
MVYTKKILKAISYVLIAGIFSIALSGCGTKKVATDPNANKIVVWSFESEDAWKPIIGAFQGANKGYTVVYEKQVFDASYETRVLNSILSTGTPDVWSMPNDWVYRHKDKLYPMSDAMAKTVDINNSFVPSIKESVVFDNKIYALSPSAEPLMIYTNPRLFSQKLDELISTTEDQDTINRYTSMFQDVPPIWSDFVEVSKLLTKKNGNTITQSGVALGTSAISNSTDILSLLMLQNETDILTSDYKSATFNLPKSTSTGANDIPGKRALEFYTSFANPSSPNYSWNDSLGNNIDAFGNGKVAMIFGYSSLQNVLLQKYPSLEYNKAFVPQLQVDTSKIKDFATFNALGVSKLSRNPDLSWKLISTLTGDSMDDFNSANKLYSSRNATVYDSAIANRTSGNPEGLALGTADSLVKGKFPEEYDSYIRSAISSVNAGKQNAQSALDLIANQITDMLRADAW